MAAIFPHNLFRKEREREDTTVTLRCPYMKAKGEAYNHVSLSAGLEYWIKIFRTQNLWVCKTA